MNTENLQKLLRKKSRFHNYISGIVDTKGSFKVMVKKQKNTKYGWVVDPIFQITLHKDNRELLEAIRKTLNCGRIQEKHGQKNLLVYVVDNRRHLVEKIVPFFEKHKLIIKDSDFQKFKEIVQRLESKEHHSKQGLMKIIEIGSNH